MTRTPKGLCRDRILDLTLAQETASQQLLARLSEECDLVEFPDRFARLSAHGLGGGKEVDCGITLTLAKRSTVVGSGSEQARLMDEVQVGFEEGPCLEAQKTDPPSSSTTCAAMSAGPRT